MTTLQSKTEMIVLSVKHGGKYSYALGEHYHDGSKCYIVAALNMQTGICKKVHFHTKEEALASWQKVCSKLDEILSKSYEEDEPQPRKVIIQ